MWSLAWLQAMLFMTAHGTVATCEPCWAHWPYWASSEQGIARSSEEWYDTRAVLCDSPKADFICTWSGCEGR